MKKLFNGYFTRYLDKFLGLKGIAFSLCWAGLFLKLIEFDWPFVTLMMALCSLKTGEDLGRQFLNNKKD